MHVKITSVMMNPKSLETANKMAEFMKELFTKEKGFQKVYFAADDEKGKYRYYVLGY
jgi:hypothetical protein